MDRLWWSSSNAPSAASFGAVGFPWPQHICGEQRWNHLTFDILMILMFSQVYHIVPWCTTYHRQIHRQIHGSSWIHWFQGGLSEVTTFGSLGFLSQSDHVERFLCSETLWKAAKWLTFRVTSWIGKPPQETKKGKVWNNLAETISLNPNLLEENVCLPWSCRSLLGATMAMHKIPLRCSWGYPSTAANENHPTSSDLPSNKFR